MKDLTWAEFTEAFDELYFDYAATRADWDEADRRVKHLSDQGLSEADISFQKDDLGVIEFRVSGAVVGHIFEEDDTDHFWFYPDAIIRREDETPVRAGEGQWSTLMDAQHDITQDVLDRLKTRGCWLEKTGTDFPEERAAKIAEAKTLAEQMAILYPPMTKETRDSLLKEAGLADIQTLYNAARRDKEH